MFTTQWVNTAVLCELKVKWYKISLKVYINIVSDSIYDNLTEKEHEFIGDFQAAGRRKPVGRGFIPTVSRIHIYAQHVCFSQFLISPQIFQGK
jgi:hypothetical protein